MNLADAGVVFGICTSLLAGGGYASQYYLDTRYVTVGGLEDFFRQQKQDELRFMIRELEWDANHGGLSEKEEWQLEEYRDQLEALE